MLELLVIEDVEADFLLIDRHLRLNGLSGHCLRVAGAEELDLALAQGGWDLVLSDYRVPGLDFRETLAEIQARLLDVPVILVSGSVGEEEAVDLLKRGLSDFILKDRLARLVPAIERSLKEAEGRRARRAAEQALRRSEMLTRSVMDSLRSTIAVLDGQGRIIHVNGAWREFAAANGADRATTRGVGLNYLDACRAALPDGIAARVLAGIERVLQDSEANFTAEYPCRFADAPCWFAMNVSPLHGPDPGAVVSHVDITVRKLAELALRESQATLAHAQTMARMGSWTADLVAGTFTASEEGARLVGWKPGVHLAEELFAIVHPDDLAVMRAAWDEATRSGSYELEHRVLVDGAVRWLHVKAEIAHDEQGRPVKAIGMSQDVTETREAQQALQAHQIRLEELVDQRTAAAREAESKFRGLVEQAFASIYIIQEGRFRYVNRAFATMFGFDSPDEVADKISVLDLVAPADRHTVLRNIKAPERAALDGIQYEFTAVRKDGSNFEVEVFGRAIGYEGKPAVIGLLLDITERKAADRAQAESLAEARRLAAARSEFLANMSHEIRTPLNAVIGLAQVGVRDSAGRRAQHTFHRILDSGQLLLGIVNDVLDFSKIEAGKLELERSRFDLGMAIDRAVHMIAPAAFDKGLDFTVSEAADLPQHCEGDVLRLSQVLVNLLSNAVKFTAHGHVSLAVGHEGDELVLQVSDSGIGMSEDQAARLFQPFEQADGSTTRRFGGTGLGLAISKRLVDMMGGSIQAHTRLAQGTCFSVRLPLVGAGAPVAGVGIRIVLAGMPAAEVERARRAVEALGAQVAGTTPDEALSAEASLVALDARALDKAQLDRAGRRAALGQRLALVCTPGLSDSVPMSLLEQVQLIERPLRARHLLAACPPAMPMPGQDVPALGSRLAGMRVLAAEDNEVNRLVLAEVLEREGAQLTLAHDGHHALARLEREGASAFDIVLTDIQMPGIDGYETTRRMRALAPDLPVIGLTAHAMAAERARCLATGMADHIAKPFDVDVLVGAMLRHCRRSGDHRAAAGAVAVPAAARAVAGAPAYEELIDRAGLSALYKNKHAFIARLLATAAETHAEAPARLREAMCAGDLDALVFLAHKLKGTAGNLVAPRLQALAASTEEAARANRLNAWQLAEQLVAAVEALLGELDRSDAISVKE